MTNKVVHLTMVQLIFILIQSCYYTFWIDDNGVFMSAPSFQSGGFDIENQSKIII